MRVRRAFTLIELLVVVAIMGLLGTAAINGYRAMQQGIEERGTMQNVNQFIRSAYQRAQIDRQPVYVFFWNETIREEDDAGVESMVAVGKAVAVRRSGRITEKKGSYLYDEFGDLRFMRLTRDEDDEFEGDVAASGSTEEGNGMYLYRMMSDVTGFANSRSLVSQTTKQMSPIRDRMVSYGGRGEIECFAYVTMPGDKVSWTRGDAYGFEFAEIQLPHNYIFGTAYSKQTDNPVEEIAMMRIRVGRNEGNGSRSGMDGGVTQIQISSLRPDDSGELNAEKIGTTENPSTL